MSRFMIYGANGYTGRLIAEEAVQKGLSPIVAGRNREAVEAVAAEFSLDARVFDLEDAPQNLEAVSSVILAAGPFVRTSAPMVDACLRQKIHYLDITGEMGIFETLHARDAEARAAGSVLLPGVGFDVVPTDCLANALAEKLPGATHLELAFSGGRASKGTTKTALAHLGDGGAIRENGVVRSVPLGWHSRKVSFYDKERLCVTIPWGDVASAYFSTGIENIRVYVAASKGMIRGMKIANYASPILTSKVLQKPLEKLIDAKIPGPDAETRKALKVEVWGQVRDDSGSQIEGTLTTPEGYTLTARCAVAAACRVEQVKPGYHTPATAFGSNFITQQEGCTLRISDSVQQATQDAL